MQRPNLAIVDNIIYDELKINEDMVIGGGVAIGNLATSHNVKSVAIGHGATSRPEYQISIGHNAGNHPNFCDRSYSVHISSMPATFVSENSNVNIANVIEADTDTHRVIIPGDLEVCGELDAPNVARRIDSCDACGEDGAFGFEWKIIDEENREASESICLRCIRRGMMQYVAKENWVEDHGDPITNLRSELTSKIEELNQKFEELKFK